MCFIIVGSKKYELKIDSHSLNDWWIVEIGDATRSTSVCINCALYLGGLNRQGSGGTPSVGSNRGTRSIMSATSLFGRSAEF